MTSFSTIDIFSELSSPMRIEILFCISEHDVKLSQIAKDLDTTIQNLQRHVTRLIRSGLIEKNLDGTMSLTPIGKMALLQLPAFEFLSQHQRFFHNHSFKGIPEYLLLRIGELRNSELIENTMEGMQKIMNHASNTQEYHFGITNLISLDMLDTAKKNLKRNVQYKIVYGKNTTAPGGYNTSPKRKFWQKGIDTKQIQEKFLDEVPINMTVSEQEAHLWFSNKNTKEADGKIFFSKDPAFRHWCLDLFEHYWRDLETVEPFKINEIDTFEEKMS